MVGGSSGATELSICENAMLPPTPNPPPPPPMDLSLKSELERLNLKKTLC